MKRSELKDTLYDWCVAALDDETIEVIFVNQPEAGQAGAGLPPKPYIAIDISAPRQTHEDAYQMREIGHPDGDEVMEYTGERVRTLGIQAFADTGDEADEIIETLRRASNVHRLRYDHLGDVAILGVLSATESGDIDLSEWQGRSSIDFEIAHPAGYTDEPGVIDSVTFTGEIDETEHSVDADLTPS